MLAPTDLHLPYQTWQPGQWDVITRIVASEKPVQLVEAPPGIGKSAIARGLATLLDQRLLVLTATRQLQDQYQQELGLYPVMGRPNFLCQLPGYTRTPAAYAPCTTGEACTYKSYTRHKWCGCPGHERATSCPDCVDHRQSTRGLTLAVLANGPVCPYYDQRYRGEREQAAVLNYSYWLHMTNYSGAYKPAGVLVCDEAQELEGELQHFLEFSYRAADAVLLQARKDMPDSHDQDHQRWQRWAQEHARRLYPDYQKIQSGEVGPAHNERERERRAALVRFVQFTGRFLCMPPDDWLSTPMQTPGRTFQPIWVHQLTPRYLQRHFARRLENPNARTVLMSATILDPDLFMYLFGLSPDDVDVITIPSPFAAASRPLVYAPVGRVKTSDLGSWRAVTREVDDILKRHPNEKGIIHTTSYALADHIRDNSRHTWRLVTHTTQTKRAALDHFRRSSHPLVWVSPSSTTGVDLPYDLCRFQVIAKLGFPSKADPLIEARNRTPNWGRRWSQWLTLCALVQAYGRGMRARDDHAVTYLIDGNWDWFRHTVRAHLPGWVKEAITRRTSAHVQAQQLGRVLQDLGPGETKLEVPPLPCS